MHDTTIKDLSPGNFKPWMGCLLALVLSLVCMFPTLENEWLNWDDEAYVLRNSMVWELDGEHVGEMFTTPEQVGLYHPLTMLSLAVDYQLWETNAFGYHLTNLILHLLNVCLVFLFLFRLRRSTFVASMGAILFGLHPMHVESVTWISARKDVLYTLFFLLALLAYLKYLRQERSSKWLSYTGLIFLFVGALLSKAIAFVFPVLLLLIDYHEARKWSWKLIAEKIPLFILSGIALWVAREGQQSSDSMMELNAYPFEKTFFIGTRNYLVYVGKLFVPWEMSPFHPFPFLGKIELPWLYYLSVIPFAVFGWVLFRFKLYIRMRSILFGIAFFTVCIGPFLQMVPYGKAVMAERYTYLSYIGLFYALGVLLERVMEGERLGSSLNRKLLLGLVGGWIIVLGVSSAFYLPSWKDGESLWGKVVTQYPDHYFGYLNRGRWRVDKGDQDMAMADLNRSVELNPGLSTGFYERGRLKEARGEWLLALADYDQAISLNEKEHRAFLNRGLIRATRKGDMSGALKDLNAAIEAQPDYALAYLNRALVLRGTGDKVAAEKDYGKAIALEPWNTVLYRYRGSFYEQEGRLTEAEEDFSEAIRQEPDRGENWFLRGRVRRAMGKAEAYSADIGKAEELGFQFPEGFVK